MSEERRLSTADAVVFALLAGAVSTFALGYYYGLVNHIEQLPQILRLLDPSYLSNDFAVNATDGYGPRFFYSWLVALLARVAPLPVVFLVLTVLQNAGTALVTFLVGRRMAGSDRAGLIAAALALSVNSIQLGEAGFLRLSALIPASLVTALALWSVWEGIEARPWRSAALALAASLIHPLLGLEAGVVGLGAAFFGALLWPKDGRQSEVLSRQLLKTALAGAALALAGFLVWVLPQQKSILSSAELVQVHAHFRNPHHILPSAFPVRDWVMAAGFLAAIVICWGMWYRSAEAMRAQAKKLLAAIGVVLLLFVAGWFFVEVVPSRFVATMQTFRLTLFVKWFGLLLIGVTAARAFGMGCPLSGLALYVPAGFVQPPAALGVTVFEVLRRWARAGWLKVSIGLVALLGAVAASVIWRSHETFRETYALIGLGLLVLSFDRIRAGARRYVAAVAAGVLFVALPILNGEGWLPVIGRQVAASRPVFTLEQAHDPADRVAEFCRSNTPEDAVFLTPPLFGRFRYTARRAIVVDFKYAMPHDWAIIEWRQRLLDCYGEVRGRGFGAAWEMESHYQSISEGRLLWLSEEYGCRYAVLFTPTPCQFPELHRDETYKLVEIPEVVPAN